MRKTVSAPLIALLTLSAFSADRKPLPYPLSALFYRDWTYGAVNDIFSERYAVNLKPLNPRIGVPSLSVASEAFLHSACYSPLRKRTRRAVPSAFFPDDNEIVVAREHLWKQTGLVAHEFVHYIVYYYSRIHLGEEWEETLANKVEELFVQHMAELDREQAGGE